MIFVLIGVCGLVSRFCYSEIQYAVYYGSVEHALDVIDVTINAAYLSPLDASMQDSLPSCGGMWFPTECWELLQTESKLSNGSYEVLDTLDYTEAGLEAGWNVRDVSDIYVQISFDGGQKSVYQCL